MYIMYSIPVPIAVHWPLLVLKSDLMPMVSTLGIFALFYKIGNIRFYFNIVLLSYIRIY